MKRNTLRTLILLSLFLVNCQSSNNKQEESSKLTGITTHFADFPEKQFETIYLLQAKNEVEEQLRSLEYKELDGQKNHFKSQKEKVEILLEGSEEISSMRIFFLAKDDVKESKRLRKLLQITAVEQKISPEFSYFIYNTKKAKFSVSLFVQMDLLRINIKLIKPN